MSVLAGIVALDGRVDIHGGQLTSMLQAMRPANLRVTELDRVSHDFALIGALSYRPDDSFSSARSDASARRQVLCTGELYNDGLGRSQSTAEFLLERYERQGADAFAVGLNGSFSAVLVDTTTREVLLATDHTASFPFFYAVVGRCLYFASEVRALICVAELDYRPCPSSVIAYATSGFFLDRRTLVHKVQRMDYASVIRIIDGSVSQRSYWRYEIEPKDGRPKRQLQSELTGLMHQAVERRVRRGRVSLLLSGGVDSRGILACLRDCTAIPAVVYSGRTLATRDSKGDWAIADRIAKLMKLNLTVVHYDGRSFLDSLQDSILSSDGAAGFVFENIWEAIRDTTGTDYVLIGDECMGWSTGITSNDRILHQLGIHDASALGNVRTCLSIDKRESLVARSLADTEALFTAASPRNSHDTIDELYFRERLINMLLPKRRVLARHGLRVRNPWLDLELLNFMRTLPSRYRIRKKLYLDSICSVQPRLFRIPRARASETVDYRSHIAKQEATDRSISESIASVSSPLVDFFDPDAVKHLLKGQSGNFASTEASKTRRLVQLLPIPLRQRLASFARSLGNPPPTLPDTVLLLRLIALSTALGSHVQLRRACVVDHTPDIS